MSEKINRSNKNQIFHIFVFECDVLHCSLIRPNILKYRKTTSYERDTLRTLSSLHEVLSVCYFSRCDWQILAQFKVIKEELRKIKGVGYNKVECYGGAKNILKFFLSHFDNYASLLDAKTYDDDCFNEKESKCI